MKFMASEVGNVCMQHTRYGKRN